MKTITRYLAAPVLAIVATTGWTSSAATSPAGSTPLAAELAAVTSSPIRPGAFCRTGDAGRTERAANGAVVRCTTTATDPRHRWRTVVK
jgi:hypothetical protein